MKKRILILILILFAVTAAITAIYLRSREKTEAGDLRIKTDSGELTVSIDKLPLSGISGEVKNQKGEIKKIDAEGYSLSDIPALAGVVDYSEISVFSDDEYHAVLSKDELSDHERAWIIKEEDMLRLIVFGDEDSKRNVKNVVRIEIR